MIPIVDVSGIPRERGRSYGEHARELIAHGVGTWKESLGQGLKGDPDEYLTRFLGATSFVPIIRERTPWVLEEIEGIAEGAGITPELMLAYNLPDEEWWYREGDAGEPRGCSVIGVRRGAGGAPLAAQNMDVPNHYAGTGMLLRIRDEDGLEATLLVYAGSTGLCGCNSEGVSICCNTLLSLRHSERGLPVNCVVRGVLAQSTLSDAAAFVRSVPHASGQAYLIGGSGDLLGVECSTGGVFEYGVGADRLWHTNHPYVSDDVSGDVDSIPLLAVSDTVARGRFIEERLGGVTDAAAIESVLSDRTVPICRVPKQPTDAITFGSIVMELTVPPTVTLAPGPPDRTPYEPIHGDAVLTT